MLEINQHYKKLVAFQIKKLEANDDLTAAEKEEFLSYISELEKENDHLKKELKNNLDKSGSTQGYCKYYKKQIELIEKLLDRLDQSKINEDEASISI